ncbi:MAG: UDP-N-acetylmuramate--L-alanine ligase [Clostridia bacterium]|nr:UDP-N-acetylmuramate--L-alanine ligase [Clostridia bacterium]
MDNNIFDKKVKSVHIVGVGGVSTSSLAEYLMLNGYAVSGSDLIQNERINELVKKGLKFKLGHRARNVKGAQSVVYTSAVNRFNPEIKLAIKKNVPLVKRSELLGQIISGHKKSVAISGCHGKTTATAMLANVLTLANLNPTTFIGGEDCSLGSFNLGNGEYAVVEACEYKKNFLDIKATYSVILNIDNDHLDTFSDIDDTVKAFSDFCANSIAIINADDENCAKIYNPTTVTFGINNSAVYTAKNLKRNKTGYSFNVYAYSRPMEKINLKVIGKHNVYNALSAIAVCDIMGVNFGTIKRALENFRGVKRRAEYLGNVFGAEIFADYAHHPKEIVATLSAFSENFDRIGVIFQPHTYSRTKFLMEDFVSALKNYNNVIYATYPAREEYDAKGDALTLYSNLKKQSKYSEYCQTPQDLLEKTKRLCLNVQSVIVMGAGDIYQIFKDVVLQKTN